MCPESPSQLADVHALLGRCLLGVQSCEVILKTILGAQTVTWPPTPARDDRRTLGAVVEDLFGRFLVTGDWSEVSDDVPEVTVRVGLLYSPEDATALRDSLRAFVAMRNSLVHQFVQRHDLATVKGCVAARDDLTRTLADIGAHFAMFRDWAESMDTARRALAAELLEREW